MLSSHQFLISAWLYAITKSLANGQKVLKAHCDRIILSVRPRISRMGTDIKKRHLPFGQRVVLTLCFATALCSFANAQMNGAGGQIKTPETVTTFMERRVRESELRRLALGDGSKTDSRADRAMYEQMNEDFKQIQLVRLKMVENIAGGKPFEYKTLIADASEIKKRSLRLRSSLALINEKE